MQFKNVYGTTDNPNDWWHVFRLKFTGEPVEKRREHFDKYLKLLLTDRLGDLDVHYRHCHEHTITSRSLPGTDESRTLNLFINELLKAGGTNLTDMYGHCFNKQPELLDFSNYHIPEIERIATQYHDEYFSVERPTR